MDERRKLFLKAGFGDDWYEYLQPMLESDFMDEILDNLKAKAAETNEAGEVKKIFPTPNNLFNAFKYCPVDVKVVLIGQDPYHTPEGAAHGLAFSSGIENFLPPSLRIMFEEIERTEGKPKDQMSPDLTRWAKQGVLLLNTYLTVFEKEPGSHVDVGWQKLINYILSVVDIRQKVVFVGLGKKAQETYQDALFPFSDNPLIQERHPAAQLNSGGKYMFVNNGLFRRINDELIKLGKDPINW